VAVDGAGNVYFYHPYSVVRGIRKITPLGVESILPIPETWVSRLDKKIDVWQTTSELYVASGGRGDLIVSNPSFRWIKQLTPQGITTVYTDTGSANRLDYYAMCVNSAGDIFVFTDRRIWKINQSGQKSLFLTVKFGQDIDNSPFYPSSAVVDSHGNFFVASRSRIWKISLTGEAVPIAGNGRTGFADGWGSEVSFSFFEVGGIAIDSAGYLYIADALNNRIRVIYPSGMVCTLAGGHEESQSYADGPGYTAGFAKPTGIAIDAQGALYVADQNNDAIRKIVIKRRVKP
jgi:hypothetical protein